jgi:cytochrome P450
MLQEEVGCQWREEPASQWFNVFDAQQMAHPGEVWSALRAKDPVFFAPELNAWLISRLEDVKAAFLDTDTFANAGLSSPFREVPADVAKVLAQVPSSNEMDVLTSDPPRHTRLRKVIRAGFQARRIKLLSDDIQALTDDLIDGMEALPGQECDFYQAFAYPLPLGVICRLVGLPTEDQPMLNHWGLCNVQLRWSNLDHDAWMEAARGRVEFYRYAEDVVRQRRERPGDDLVSEIIATSSASEEPLREMELVGMVMTCVTAGHETSANFLTIGLHTLLSNRELWQQLVADDRQRLPAIVDELLRVTAASQINWRTVTKPVTVAGVELPAGARVGLMIGCASRDESIFDHGDAVDFGRPNLSSSLAFGHGIHACVGAPLARLEGRVAFATLARRLPSLELAAKQPDLAFKPNATLRCPTGLQVRWC